MSFREERADSISLLKAEARDFGKEIAELLRISSFTSDQKEAWVTLVPVMSPDELQRFYEILVRQVEGEVVGDAEDVILLLKAAKMKHDFALKHAEHSAEKGINEIQKEIDRILH